MEYLFKFFLNCNDYVYTKQIELEKNYEKKW